MPTARRPKAGCIRTDKKAICPMAFFDVLYLISRIKPNRIPAFGENSLDMEENRGLKYFSVN